MSDEPTRFDSEPEDEVECTSSDGTLNDDAAGVADDVSSASDDSVESDERSQDLPEGTVPDSDQTPLDEISTCDAEADAQITNEGLENDDPKTGQPSLSSSEGATGLDKGDAKQSVLAGKPFKIVVGVVVAIIAVIGLCVAFVHNWSDATCTQPQTCLICGATQGEPLGHDWVDATCTEPKICSRCGEQEGVALGHDWGDWETVEESTCTVAGSQQRTCARCGATEQEELPLAEHQPGDWEVVEKPTISASGTAVPGRRIKSCKVCGTELESETINLSAEEIKKQYKSSCESCSYEEVARNPDSYEGKRVKFKGEVIQVLQDGNDYTLRVNVTKVSYGYTDTIMVAYTAADGDPRILEDDVVTLYGTMQGMYSYESVLGATITVPLMFAVYAE